ncbi:hypothetical protein FZEAL_5595 [Fusarium zealandicum]|uniref:Uncharacterized protein n=1 Tax=Fusarium zealandicum TaxID=1053134 RepID=A0A8H4UJU7_9HYPO|nr:hypothetical protein FZEAL_5595 [Fusarium zealandicum]
MDEYLFDKFTAKCRVVFEATSYMEILKYSANAKNPDTFTPDVISLPYECYRNMAGTFKLPTRAIEASAAVGPLFWSSEDHDDDDPHLQIIYRKADVRKKGKTRGWEMMLSYSFKTNITSGYVKGTPTSYVVEALEHLKGCATQVAHPMLLPVIFYSLALGPINDAKQRATRDWLRRVEHALHLDPQKARMEETLERVPVDVDSLSKELVECHASAIRRPPRAYQCVANELESAMQGFWTRWTAVEQSNLTAAETAERKMAAKLHKSMLSRIHFYKVKLTALENYIHTSLERLKVQREELSNMISQRDAKFNIEMAREQRRIAHASKRDSTAMKTLSFIGALFLPGTFLATVFGTSFFKFEDNASPVSRELWIFFAVTVPVTVLVVVFWIWYEAQQRKGDADLERDIEDMEKNFMFV